MIGGKPVHEETPREAPCAGSPAASCVTCMYIPASRGGANPGGWPVMSSHGGSFGWSSARVGMVNACSLHTSM